MRPDPLKSVLVIIAHPDDETLWAGGTLLSNPSWHCFVLCLCRGSDRDRAPKFHQALRELGATGTIGDLDDSPEQPPLHSSLVEQTILERLPAKRHDLIITHSPKGEYTRHLRHEEVGKAVIHLWNKQVLSTDELWSFAYDDNNRADYPRAIRTNTASIELSASVWEKKYAIITKTYGFEKNSWEARTTPKAEAFWQFANAEQANVWASENTPYRKTSGNQ